MLSFLRSERGYVTTLTLISMPMLLGFALLIIDVGRGNNLHTDLQHAVDSLALAGARELNGTSTAITRSDDAIRDLVKNQARFVDGGPIIMDKNQVDVTYLDAIPVSDDDPIDVAWIAAHGTNVPPANAAYVLVRSHVEPMTTLFPIPVGFNKDTIDFQAEAVATYTAAVCDVTPMFICNPFAPQNLSMQQAFAQGLTYGRQILSLKAGNVPGPGNFGLLDTDLDLRTAFGVGAAGQCYSQKSVTTKTGVNFGPVYSGMNVRFDIYANNLNKDDYKLSPLWRPSVNVRKGTKNGSNCGKFQSEDDITKAMGFPMGNNFNATTNMTDSTWDRTTYWKTNHPQATMPATITSKTDPTGTNHPPSRYDVYRYEIDKGLIGEIGTGKNKETGTPSCYQGPNLTDNPDRRVIFAAIVNCGDFSDPNKHTTGLNGKVTVVPDSFVSIFLTNPIERADKSDIDTGTGSIKPISFEIVDVTGGAGNGSLDQFLREESTLVR